MSIVELAEIACGMCHFLSAIDRISDDESPSRGSVPWNVRYMLNHANTTMPTIAADVVSIRLEANIVLGLIARGETSGNNMVVIRAVIKEMMLAYGEPVFSLLFLKNCENTYGQQCIVYISSQRGITIFEVPVL